MLNAPCWDVAKTQLAHKMTLLAHSLHSACTALAQRLHTVCTQFLGLRRGDTPLQQPNMHKHLPDLPSLPPVLVHMHAFLFSAFRF